MTLLAAAGEIAGGLGLPAALPEAIIRGYLELARGAVAAAGRTLDAGRPLGAAITGPVARGDAALFRRQLEALRAQAPDKLPLARALARETLRQRQENLPGIAAALEDN